MTRHPLIHLLAAGASLIGLTSSAQSAIFDRDDRQYVSPSVGSPYSPVGLVKDHSLLSVWWINETGFLVDDCHVLTSEGAVFGLTPVGKRLTFEAAIGTREQQSTKGTVVAVGGYKRELDRTMEQRYESGRRNWVLLRLDKCIGKTLGHVAMMTGPFSPFEFEAVQSASYPADRTKERGLTLDPSCKILWGKGAVWGNDCAVSKRDVGAPIFRIAERGGRLEMQVYAMQSWALRGDKPISLQPRYANQAVPMTVIAPQIDEYLSLNQVPQAGSGLAASAEAEHKLSDVGGDTRSVAGERLLDTGTATTH